MHDDAALVNEAMAGDARSFGALLRRHDDNMRGVVYRVVGSQSAMDDVLQDAYLKAWRSVADFRGDSAFSTWLYTIVHRTAIDHLRAQKRMVPVDPGRMGDASMTAEAVVQPVDVASNLALRQALAELSPEQLAVVSLIDGEGYTYHRVATMLGISAGTIASRLHRARAALRAALEDPSEAERQENRR